MRWSQRVTRESDALDLEHGVFTLSDPRAIARSLQRSAERSTRRKTDPFRSAMSMLTFYVNRAGRHLSDRGRARLESAKNELRALYGRAPEASGASRPEVEDAGASTPRERPRRADGSRGERKRPSTKRGRKRAR